MPFFWKSCLKFRRKQGKSKKEKDIQPFSDVISPVTNIEIWKQYTSNSTTSDITQNEQHGESSDNRSRITSSLSESDIDRVSINGNVNTGHSGSVNNRRNASTTSCDAPVCKKSDVICHMALIEDRSIENTNKQERVFEKLSQKDEVTEENIKTIANNAEIINDKVIKTTSADCLSNSSLETNLQVEKSIDIINKVTVSSDVFNVIEELKSLMVADIKHTGDSENDKMMEDPTVGECEAQKESEENNENEKSKENYGNEKSAENIDYEKSAENIDYEKSEDSKYSEDFEEMRDSEESEEMRDSEEYEEMRDSEDSNEHKENVEPQENMEFELSHTSIRKSKDSLNDETPNDDFDDVANEHIKLSSNNDLDCTQTLTCVPKTDEAASNNSNLKIFKQSGEILNDNFQNLVLADYCRVNEMHIGHFIRDIATQTAEDYLELNTLKNTKKIDEIENSSDIEKSGERENKEFDENTEDEFEENKMGTGDKKIEDNKLYKCYKENENTEKIENRKLFQNDGKDKGSGSFENDREIKVSEYNKKCIEFELSKESNKSKENTGLDSKKSEEGKEVTHDNAGRVKREVSKLDIKNSNSLRMTEVFPPDFCQEIYKNNTNSNFEAKREVAISNFLNFDISENIFHDITSKHIQINDHSNFKDACCINANIDKDNVYLMQTDETFKQKSISKENIPVTLISQMASDSSELEDADCSDKSKVAQNSSFVCYVCNDIEHSSRTSESSIEECRTLPLINKVSKFGVHEKPLIGTFSDVNEDENTSFTSDDDDEEEAKININHNTDEMPKITGTDVFRIPATAPYDSIINTVHNVQLKGDSFHIHEKENMVFNSEYENKVVYDIPTILDNGAGIVNKNYTAHQHANILPSDLKNNGLRVIHRNVERSNNPNLLESGCIENKTIIDRTVSASFDIELDDRSKRLHSKEVIDCKKLIKYSDIEKPNVHIHTEEIPEMSICQNEFCSDENEYFLNENSENEDDEWESESHTGTLEDFEENEEHACHDHLRSHIESHNLIPLHGYDSTSKRMGANHTISSTKNSYTNQEICQEVCKNKVHKLTNKETIQHFNENMYSGDSPICDILPNTLFRKPIKKKVTVEEESNTNNRKIKSKSNSKEGNIKFDKIRNKHPLKRCNPSSHYGSSELSEYDDVGSNVIAKNIENTVISAYDNKSEDTLHHDIMSLRLTEEISGNRNARTVVKLNKNNMSKSQKENKLKVRITRKYPEKSKNALILKNRKTGLLSDGNIYDQRNSGDCKSISYPIKKNVYQVGTHENKQSLRQGLTNKEKLILMDPSQLSHLDGIENILRQSIERYNRKKANAFAKLKLHFRDIPIKKTNSLKMKCIKPQTLRSGKSRYSQKSSEVYKQNQEIGIFDSLPSPVHVRYSLNSGNIQNKIKESSADMLFSECYKDVSETSEKTTPDRRRILNASRHLRSPKNPFKMNKKSSNAVLYRTKPVFIKPSRMNLVAYITKGENNVYKIKKGYRIGNATSRKSKLMGSERNSRSSAVTSVYQSHHPVNNRTISPVDLKIKFDDAFKKYASKGRPNGELISYTRSTEWLRDAGLIGKTLTKEEANDVFKCIAGVKVALNKGDYRHFLYKLTRIKKLNYNDIYEKLCSTVNKEVC